MDHSVEGRFKAKHLNLGRGLVVALVLSLLFLAATAYQSAATLWSRIDSTDVMRAASGAALSGRLMTEVAYFVAAQLLLHGLMGVTAWVLAICSALMSPLARVKFVRVVVAWFLVLAMAAIAYNAYWFPRTLMGAYYNGIASTPLGPIPLGVAFYWLVLAAAVLTLLRAALLQVHNSGFWEARRRPALVATAIATLIVGFGTFAASRHDRAEASVADRPNVIILGVDSLRLDQLKRFGGAGLTPNLDAFLVDADLFRDTTTPAARTFSSWVAILTGRSPTVTGARFNLAARDSVAANPTLADVLRGRGYRTVFSTDESRFANIDESYGFDQVITPRIGAPDFLVGSYNELPLASVVINSRVGKWLFPYSYANRGVATMFQPGTYLDRLDREMEFDGPTLFIAHLTAPHWPYYTSETPFGVSVKKSADDRPMYRIGLQTGDRMFGELLSMLERKGALRNSLVIALSDHGEALGLVNDTFLRINGRTPIEGLKAPIEVKDFGHGQSVLSPAQYRVLLAFKAYGRFSEIPAGARAFSAPSTVEDIAPTVLDLLGVPGNPIDATGRSLAPLLRGSPGIAYPSDRIRFTETDLSVLPAPDGGVDEVGTARQNSMFFEVDPATARLKLSAKYRPLAIAYKERAAFTPDLLLAALPAGPDGHQFLLFDTESGSGKLLLGRPADADPEAQRLWDAIHAHYADELRTPVAVTREDWPRIAQEWRAFLSRPRQH